jgi:dsRNA-specific ribonuclease
MDLAKIRNLEDRLGYTFNDKGLLIRALTHSTFSNAENQKKIGQKIARIRELMPLSVMQF